MNSTSALQLHDPINSISPAPGLFTKVRSWFTVLVIILIAAQNSLFTQADMASNSTLSLNADTGSSLIPRLMTALFVVVIGSLIFKRLLGTIQTLIQSRDILLFVMLATVSMSWSQVPFDTLRHAVILLITILYAMYFSTYYSPATQMRLMLASGTLIAVGSIVMAVFLPRYGVTYTGEWKGVFGHKNQLGLGMIFLFSALPYREKLRDWQRLAVGALSVTAASLVLLSRSATSFTLLLSTIGLAIFSKMYRSTHKGQRAVLIYGSVISFVVILGLAATNFASLTETLGKDPTLTGRTRNWGILLTFALQHVWLGYGYQGFWTGLRGDSGSVVSGAGGGMHGADNGYLDALLDLGIAGLIMLAVIVFGAIRNAVNVLSRSRSPQAAFWYFSLIVLILIAGFTETVFWIPGALPTFCLVVACSGLRSMNKEGMEYSS